MEEVYASSSTTCLYYCHSVIYLTAIMSMNFIANEMATRQLLSLNSKLLATEKYKFAIIEKSCIFTIN